MKTLLILNLVATGLLFSWAAFATQSITPSAKAALNQAAQLKTKKNNSINTIGEQPRNIRQTSRLVARPIIHPLHFH